METAPRPLAPSARALSRQRYHAAAHGSKNERGAYPFIAEGRFPSKAQAQRWIDLVYPNAYLGYIDFLSERDNWQPHRIATRRDGVWESDHA